MVLLFQLSCCGIHNASDWYHITAWPEQKWVPQSCCIVPYVNCELSENTADWHQKVGTIIAYIGGTTKDMKGRGRAAVL